jgi:hypothetical protein
MAALTCPYSSLSPDLERRTLIYHTIHGIARYLTSPAEDGVAPHPLGLAFVLGLSSKVAWYPSDYSTETAIPQSWSNTLSRIMYEYGVLPVWEVDSLMLRIRLQRLATSASLSSQESSDFMRLLSDYAAYYSSSSPYLKELIMKEHDFSKVPQDVYNKLDAALSSLEKALLEKDPLMKNHLRESHALLVTYPETVVLLKPEEVNTLIRAAEKHTQTQIVADVVKGKGTGITRKKSVSVDDI